MRIEIDIKQEKHGELIVKLNGLSIGELSDLDPIEEFNKLSDNKSQINSEGLA